MPKSKYDILNVGYGVLNPMSAQAGYDKVYDPDEAGFFGLVRQTAISHFAPNISNMGPLIGICLRYDGMMNHGANASALTWAQKHSQLIEGERPPRLMQVRVRIPEIHSWLPIPTTLPLAAEVHKDHEIINMYPLFLAQTENIDGNNPPGRGELVWVDFQNKETLEGPIYLGQVRQSTTTIPSNTSKNAKGAHKGKGTRGKGSDSPGEGGPADHGAGSAKVGETARLPYDSESSAYEQLKPSDGVRPRSSSRNNQYGAPATIKAIENIGKGYFERAEGDGGNSFLVGNISKDRGGQLGSHKSHKKGIDVDIGFPWKTANGVFTNNSGNGATDKAWNEIGSEQMNWHNLELLIDLCFQEGAIVVFMNDNIANYKWEEGKKSLFEKHPKANPKNVPNEPKKYPHGIYDPNVGYDYNHFHVRFPEEWADNAKKIAEFNSKVQDFYA
jgi:hypothetical protein